MDRSSPDDAAGRLRTLRGVADIVQSVSDGVVALDRQWRYTYVNASAARMLGRSAESLLGQSYYEAYPEAAGTPFERAYRKAMEERVAVLNEDHYAPWGRWFENRIYPLDEGITIFFIEITERKRAEQALRESEQRFRLVASTGVVWEVDIAAGSGFVPSQFTRSLGYEESELDGSVSAFEALVHPQDRPLWKRTLAGHLKHRAPYVLEFRARAKGGEYRWFDTRGQAVWNEAGRAVYMAGIVFDISERKRVEDALRDSEERYRKLAELSPDAILIHSDHRIVFANRAMAQLMRADDSAALLGRPSDFMLPTDMIGEVRTRVEHLYAGQGVQRMDQTYLRLDGTSVPVEVASAPLLLQGRQAAQVTVRDISARRQAEDLLEGQRRVLEMIAEGRPLQQTLELLAQVIEAQADGMLVSILLLDADGKHLRHGASPSLPEEFSQAIDGEPIGPRAGSCGTSAFRRAPVVTEDIQTDPLWDDYRALAMRHGLRASWSTPIFDAQRRLVGTFALYFRSPRLPDAVHMRLVEVATSTAGIAIGRHREVEALRSSEASLAAAQQRAKLGSWEFDLDTLTGHWSAQMFVLFGREPRLGVPNLDDFAALVHPQDRAQLMGVKERAASGAEPQAIDFRSDPARGEVRHFSAQVEVVCDADGRRRMVVGTVHDITERKISEARIEYMASHDGLTGLVNRNMLQDRIVQAVSHVRRLGRTTAVVLLNLDRFQIVNSGYGSEFGDAMLRSVGTRLAALVRDGDTVARLGADEFAILLTDIRRIADIHGVLQKVLEGLAQPLVVDGREAYVTASLGVSLYPQDGSEPGALIRNADVAMRHAKQLGGNNCQFFAVEMSGEPQRLAMLESQLRQALVRKELHLVYQPKVSLTSGAVVGVEALLRWTHPELGVVSPGVFIPLAEETGLVVPIGDWVLRTACRQNKAWQDAGLPAVVMSVNISARQFLQQDVVAWVRDALDDSGLPPQRLELELTESLIAQDVEKVIATIDALKSAGVKFSIDDFGTGYSSLSHLKRFNVDTLKIDQSFIHNMLTEPNDAAICLAVIGLAHTMKMNVIAEGVETAAHCELLRINGCDEMQGYYFSRPVPAADMETLLRSGKRLEGTV